MTLEEAIAHAEEKARCGGKCGEDHAQLAEWLKELQKLRTVKTEERNGKSAQNVPKEDLISRKAVIEALDSINCCGYVEEPWDIVRGIIERVPAAESEKRTEERTETHACDLIERQAVIDAILAVTGNASVRELYEHVQEHGLSDMWSGGVNAALDIIIAVPPAEPTQTQRRPNADSTQNCALDCISRRAAIEAVGSMLRRKFGIGGDLAEITLAGLPSAQPEIVRCKECKYWKDSDGVYRRGFDAESKCPLNLKKVYEGTFYCGMAERRTDENNNE